MNWRDWVLYIGCALAWACIILGLVGAVVAISFGLGRLLGL